MIMTLGLCAGMMPPGTETRRGGEAHWEAEDVGEELHRQEMSYYSLRMLENIRLSEE